MDLIINSSLQWPYWLYFSSFPASPLPPVTPPPSYPPPLLTCFDFCLLLWKSSDSACGRVVEPHTDGFLSCSLCGYVRTPLNCLWDLLFFFPFLLSFSSFLFFFWKSSSKVLSLNVCIPQNASSFETDWFFLQLQISLLRISWQVLKRLRSWQTVNLSKVCEALYPLSLGISSFITEQEVPTPNNSFHNIP